MAKKKKKKKRLKSQHTKKTTKKKADDKSNTRLLLVGKGPGRGLAPRGPVRGCEIFGINNVCLEQHVDVIFDMHDLTWTEEECYRFYDHLHGIVPDEELKKRAKLRKHGFNTVLDYAKQSGKPLISVKQYEGIPNSRAYPLTQIVKKYDCDYFTSAVPYCIAYAMYKGYKSIELFGINCDSKEEWAYQRGAVSHWLGIAKGVGLDIRTNGTKTRILRCPNGLLYGYNLQQMPRGFKTKDGWIEPKDKNEIIEKPNMDDMIKREFEVWKES